MNFYLFHTSSTYIGVHTAPGALTAGAANHVVITYDGSETAAGVSIYVDGALVTGTVAHDNLSGSTASTSAVGLGINPFAGAIGEVLIFNRVLSATDVLNLYNHGPAAY